MTSSAPTASGSTTPLSSEASSPGGRPPDPRALATSWPTMPYGTSSSASSPLARSTTASASPTANRASRLDLPMPASPSTSTTFGWPPRASAAAASSTASSSARPTNTPSPGGRPALIRWCTLGLAGSCPSTGLPCQAEPGSPPLASRSRAISASRACLASASSRRQPSSLPGDTPTAAPRWRAASRQTRTTSINAPEASSGRCSPFLQSYSVDRLTRPQRSSGKARSTPSTVSPAAASSAVKAGPKSA